DPDSANDGHRLGVIEVPAELLGIVLGEHVVGVLAALRPADTRTPFGAKAPHELVAEHGAYVVAVDGDHVLAGDLPAPPAGIEASAVRHGEGQRLGVFFGVDRRRTIGYRHDAADARNCTGQLVALAFDPDEPLGLNIVKAVKDEFAAALEAEVLALQRADLPI